MAGGDMGGFSLTGMMVGSGSATRVCAYIIADWSQPHSRILTNTVCDSTNAFRLLEA